MARWNGQHLDALERGEADVTQAAKALGEAAELFLEIDDLDTQGWRRLDIDLSLSGHRGARRGTACGSAVRFGSDAGAANASFTGASPLPAGSI